MFHLRKGSHLSRDRGQGAALAAGFESLVVFTLNGDESAIPTEHVHEVLRMVAVTPLPGAPSWLAGVVNLRGRVVPVIDLRTRFGVPAGSVGLATPIVVVEAGDVVAGLIVDAVSGMVGVGTDDLAWQAVSDAPSPFVSAVARVSGRLILVTDVSAVCDGVTAFSPGTA